MIIVESVLGNVVKIIVPEKLEEDDFFAIGAKVDAIIGQQGAIRLLIDATNFTGWVDMTAFENHMAFVKAHQRKVDRLAVIVGHAWQHWLIGTLKMFLHPESAPSTRGRRRMRGSGWKD